jgi:hypothetical protein
MSKHMGTKRLAHVRACMCAFLSRKCTNNLSAPSKRIGGFTFTQGENFHAEWPFQYLYAISQQIGKSKHVSIVYLEPRSQASDCLLLISVLGHAARMCAVTEAPQVSMSQRVSVSACQCLRDMYEVGCVENVCARVRNASLW